MEDDILTKILVNLGYFGIAAFVFKMWYEDLTAHKSGQSNEKALPGATPCAPSVIWIGIAGALIILGIETGGEYALGVSDEQDSLGWLMLLPLLAAGFVEELIFRGFLVIKKNRATLIGSIVGFSVLFAIIHTQLWKFAEDTSWWEFSIVWKLDSAKAWWSTSILFINSVWFYTLRFLPQNPERSLWPCIWAHLVSNAGVFFIKLAQGHIEGLA
jgi:membrane protease YdiL (CAAX protease family)